MNSHMVIENLSSTYRVKKIQEEDLNQVLKLAQANPQYYAHCPPEPTIENLREDLQALPTGMERKDKWYLGFWEENILVAVCDLIFGYPDQETLYIGFFMMNPTLQGKGVGSMIIGELLDHLKGSFKRSRLAYVLENRQAEQFWLKQGFTPIEGKVQLEHYQVVVMEKSFG